MSETLRSGDGRERELKMRVEDLDAVADRVAALGGRTLAARSFEDNVLLDRNGDLLASGRALRVRREGDRCTLTFKGSAHFEASVKIRREIESEVADAESVVAILRSVGFEPGFRYQKYRTTLELRGSVVSLDETPIGSYVEIEGGDPAAVAAALELDPASAESLSYPELYQVRRETDAELPRDMIFVP